MCHSSMKIDVGATPNPHSGFPPIIYLPVNEKLRSTSLTILSQKHLVEKLKQLLSDKSKLENYEGLYASKYYDVDPGFLGFSDFQSNVSSEISPKINISSDFPLSQERIQLFLKENFVDDLASRIALSDIDIRPDLVYLNIVDRNNDVSTADRGEFGFVKLEVFQSFFQPLTDLEKLYVSQFVLRARSFYKNNTDDFFIPTQISLFNQDFDIVNYALLQGKSAIESYVPYLDDISHDQKRTLYILGLISHEIGHHIYEYYVKKNTELLNKWIAYSQKSSNLTQYVAIYSNSNMHDEENFCEAVRIYTTNPNYLQTNSPEIYLFISNNFSDILK